MTMPARVARAGIVRGLITGTAMVFLAGAMADQPLPPQVDLSVLEPGVRAALSEARSHFDDRAAAAGADDAALAEAWGQLGMAYQAHHLQQAASACYERAVELDPGEFRWQYYLAYLHQERGEYGLALDRYQSALQLDPEYLPARLRAGQAHLADQDLEGAQADFAAVVEASPGNAAALAGLGQVALRQGRFDEAVRYLESALRVEPGADRLYYPLGMAYRQQGDMARARDNLARRGNTDPAIPDPVLAQMARLTRSAQMYLEQGYAASRGGRLQESVEAFRKAVEFNPDDVTARVSLGQGLVLIGDYETALEEFNRALALDPEHPVANYRRGTLLEESGDDAGASADYATALRADPGYSQAGLRLGDALMRLGRYREAAQAYATVELAGDEQALIRYRGGLASLAGGACDAAVTALEEAFELKPDSGEIYQALARAYATCVPANDPRRGQGLELARALFEARRDEAHAETLAMALAGTGSFSRAVELQEQVVESSEGRNDAFTSWRQEQLQRYRSGEEAAQAWPTGHPVYRPARFGAGPQPAAGR